MKRQATWNVCWGLLVALALAGGAWAQEPGDSWDYLDSDDAFEWPAPEISGTHGTVYACPNGLCPSASPCTCPVIEPEAPTDEEEPRVIENPFGDDEQFLCDFFATCLLNPTDPPPSGGVPTLPPEAFNECKDQLLTTGTQLVNSVSSFTAGGVTYNFSTALLAGISFQFYNGQVPLGPQYGGYWDPSTNTIHFSVTIFSDMNSAAQALAEELAHALLHKLNLYQDNPFMNEFIAKYWAAMMMIQRGASDGLFIGDTWVAGGIPGGNVDANALYLYLINSDFYKNHYGVDKWTPPDGFNINCYL